MGSPGQSDNRVKDEQRSGAVRYDLAERLLDYAAAVIRLVERLPPSRAGNHVGGQLLRSGTSASPIHGEAQAAESPRDFVHKMRVCLKELNESDRWLRLIQRVPLVPPGDPELTFLIRETDELVRIFASSIRTAHANARQRTAPRPRKV